MRTSSSPSSQASAVLRLLRPHRALCLQALGLSVVARAAGLVLPYSTRYLLDRVLAPRDLHALPGLVAVVLGATAVQGLAGFALMMLLGGAGERMLAGYRVRVQAHVGRLPVAFFDSRSKGELTARIMKDAGGVRDLLGPAAVEAVGGLLTGMLAVPWLLSLSWRMALPALGMLVVAAGALRVGARQLQPAYARCAGLEARLTGRLTESLAAVRVVKAYTAEAAEAKLFGAGVKELAEGEIAVQQGQARLALASNAVLVVATPLVVWLGAREVSAGRMTAGAVVGFVAVLAYAAVGARHAGGLKAQFARALAALERTEALLGEREEELDGGEELGEGFEVAFEDVSFGYEAGREVLHGVSFVARAGEVTALVGASGAGKSTVMALACGFYAPGSGRVTVGGRNLKEVRLGEYRERLGLVPQEAFLFSDTLEANVRFARAGASEEAVREAFAAAYVDEFARGELAVGERGVRLSGGQQQRVCLARAVLADARVLLLDEATSALDAESEGYVQAAMERLRAGRTTLVIAHRMSTIRKADLILVMDGGKIVERGRHEELMAGRGRYWRMVEAARGFWGGDLAV